MFGSIAHGNLAMHHVVLTKKKRFLSLAHVGDTKHEEFARARCHDVHGPRASRKQQPVYRTICKAAPYS